MGNRINILRTEFKDYLGTSYGYRMFDDYDQTYYTQEEPIPTDDLEFLQMVVKNPDERIVSMLDFVMQNEMGLFIDEKWYTFQMIEKIIRENF